MAGKNQVTLTFAGDSSKLEKAFESVGESARKMDGDVGKASREVGSSFDTVGDAADGAEGKAQGFSDTLTGTKDVMGGVGEIAKGNLFEGFVMAGQGMADLAGGVASFLIPALKNGVTWIKSTTVAQKALNLAMRLNPIGLIITALVLLGVGLVLLWKKSETFRKIVTGAMKAVATAFGWIVKGFGVAWKAVGEAWTRFAGWVGGWKESITKRVGAIFSAIGGAFGTAWRAVGDAWGRFVQWIGGWPASVARWLGTALFPFPYLFGKAWTALGESWGRFTKWVGGWKKAFSFSGMFDGITGAAKSAFNWLISKWNSLSFSMPSVDTHIPGVGRIGGWSIGTPDIPYFHSGGIVPGGLGSESLAVLRAGERVTAGSNGGAGPTIVLKSDGSRVGKLLLQILREAIRIEGGDVQVVLGR